MKFSDDKLEFVYLSTHYSVLRAKTERHGLISWKGLGRCTKVFFVTVNLIMRMNHVHAHLLFKFISHILKRTIIFRLAFSSNNSK